MPIALKSQAGFSLMELLVAVLILAVGLLGLAELQITAMRTNSQSATATAASALAQKVIEELAAMPADDAMFDGPGTGTWPGSPVSVAGAGTYAITYEVEEVKPTSSTQVTNLYQVTVVVSSTTGLMHVLGNRQRLVEATTLKRAI